MIHHLSSLLRSLYNRFLRKNNQNGLFINQGIFIIIKLAVVFLLLFFLSSLSAEDIFINWNSTVPDPIGTIEAPFRSIQEAINRFNVTGHPVVADNILTFQILTGTYHENLRLVLDSAAIDINEWNFRAYNGEVRITGNPNAPIIEPKIVMFDHLMGADISFDHIIFSPDIPAINTGFFTSAPCNIGNLTFSWCEFSNLYDGILITEQRYGLEIMNVDDFIVHNCTFNGTLYGGRGIYSWAHNIDLGGDNHKFIKKIHIHDNIFRTDGIVDPVLNYILTNVRITTYRKDAAAYDSVFVFNNNFVNNQSNIRPIAIFFDGLNRKRLLYNCDNKCKAFAYDNTLKNNNVYAELSDLKYTHNKAYTPDFSSEYFITFISDPDVGIDTLWTDRNYINAKKVFTISNAVLIDNQNSHLGEILFLDGTASNVDITNSLITGFSSVFNLLNCQIQSQYCYYDFIVNDIQVNYGPWIFTGDPLIGRDDENMTYTLRWNVNEKSPCIMSGYLFVGTTLYDKPDIGAVQYSAAPHTYHTYQFPPHNERNGIKWMSFPTIDRIYHYPDNAMAFNLFSPLASQFIISDISYKLPGSDIQHISINSTTNWWDGTNELVLPTYGYKFTMSSLLENQLQFQIAGLKPDLSETPIHLFSSINLKNEGYPDFYENWIGYFGTKTLSPQDAFGPFLDNIFFIQTQNWTMVRDYQGHWTAAISPHTNLTLKYGDMVVVGCYSDIPEMHWSAAGQELEPYEKEDLEHFQYEEKTEYIPFFIDFEGTDLPKEVAIYLNNVCKGGAVVKDKLVEVPAYILEDMPEYPEIEFRLYYENKAGDIIPTYSTMNNITGVYENKTISIAREQYYYRVKIKTSNSETSPEAKLYLTNYPNPFNSNTNIEYYVPKDAVISINIFNVKGQKVKSLVSSFQLMGMHSVDWNGLSDDNTLLGNGVYFASLNYNGKQTTKKTNTAEISQKEGKASKAFPTLFVECM